MRRSLRAARATTPAQTAATSTGEGVAMVVQWVAVCKQLKLRAEYREAVFWTSNVSATHVLRLLPELMQLGAAAPCCPQVCVPGAGPDGCALPLPAFVVWRVLDPVLRLCVALETNCGAWPAVPHPCFPPHCPAPAGLASFGSSATAATAGLTARWVLPLAPTPGSCSCPVRRGGWLHAGQLPPLPCLRKGAWLLRLARAPRKPHVSQPSLYRPLPPCCSAWA